ncbi:hypothetical protein [Polaribacter sp.]
MLTAVGKTNGIDALIIMIIAIIVSIIIIIIIFPKSLRYFVNRNLAIKS